MWDRLSKMVFLASSLGLVFFAGIGITEYKVFPYDLIRQAKNGLEALMQLEDRSTLNAVAFEAPDAEPGPHYRTYSPAAGTEPLLITGGFYQYMSECPEHGCAAWIAARDGTVLHSWQIDPAEITEGATGFDTGLEPNDIRVVGTRLADDGSLIATFHARNSFPYTVGLAKFDRDSNLVWKRIDGSHHWFDLDPEGNIYVASARPVETKPRFGGTVIGETCPLDRYNGDGLAVISPAGDLVRRFDMTELLIENDYRGALYAVRDGCDPHHVNSVEYLTAAKAAKVEGASAGDLIVSVREHNMIAILNSRSGKILHAALNRSTAQHSPQLLANGRIAVFDNLGGDPDAAGSRILSVDPDGTDSATLFPNPDGPPSPLPPFWSGDGGHIDVSPDGTRLLVSSKGQSTSFEFDVRTGEVLWSMDKIMDVTPYLQMHGNDAHPPSVGFNAYSAYYLTAEQISFLSE